MLCSCSRRLNLSARRGRSTRGRWRSIISRRRPRYGKVRSKKYGGTFSRAGFRRTIPSPTVRFGSPRIVHESLMMATSLSYLTILITITHARRTAHCVPPRALHLYSVPSIPFTPSSDYSFRERRRTCVCLEIIPRARSWRCAPRRVNPLYRGSPSDIKILSQACISFLISFHHFS